jgi:predicted CXXCH cytochrome family protein
MKTRTLITALGTAVAGLLVAGVQGDIVGSAHDFSGTSWAGGEICKPCHTPHFASDIGYLWAHTLSTQTYTLFDGSTSSAGGVDELDKYTRMCLSCHDGTVALNDFHNGGGPLIYIDDGAKIGVDLSNDHPVGIEAAYNIAGSSSWQPATLHGTGHWGFGPGFFPEVPLFEFEGEQVVSCSTCHNPHGKTGIDHLLRKDNADSALCLTCHIK